jgi:uncharacterized protein involved in exopolysaccharide biosynthesis
VSTQREVDGLEKEVKSEDDTGERVRQLEEAKAQLARAREKYSAEFPDVVILQRIVDGIQAEVDAAAAAGSKSQPATHADNPVYIQVKGQLDSLGVERDSAAARLRELRAKYEDYQRRLAQSPEVEKEYRELARELDSAQLQYQQMLAKLTDTQVSENLETQRKGEKFTLIEPPQVPEKPQVSR